MYFKMIKHIISKTLYEDHLRQTTMSRVDPHDVTQKIQLELSFLRCKLVRALSAAPRDFLDKKTAEIITKVVKSHGVSNLSQRLISQT